MTDSQVSLSAQCVVLVSHDVPFPATSGGRIRTMQLAPALERRGANVTVVSYDWSWKTRGRRRRLTIDGIQHVVLNPLPSGLLSTMLHRARLRMLRNPYARYQNTAYTRQLLSELDSLNPSVVDFQLSCAWQRGPWSTVVTFSNVEHKRLEGSGRVAASALREIRRTEERAVMNADAVVAVSSDDARRIAELDGGSSADIHVVPTGYKPPWLQGREGEHRHSPSTIRTVGFVGSFDYAPNLEAARALIDLWPAMKADAKLERLVIIGRKASAHFNPGNDIDVRSDVVDMGDALRDVDLLVVPLTWGGGIRIKLIEAFACRIPVLSTSIGAEGLGARNDKEILIEDDIEAFGTRIARLLPQQLQSITESAFDLWRREFAPDQMASRMEAVYVASLGTDYQPNFPSAS